MSRRYQAGILGVGFNPLQAPNAPTSVTATAGVGSASVAFTAPANVGGSAISSYRVLANPGGVGATTASSPVTFSGLTESTTYTFSVAAVNSYGFSPYSAAATTTTVTPIEDIFSTYLYTGTGSALTITNGMNLSGQGGLVWIKGRTNLPGGTATLHLLTDTNRGAGYTLQSQSIAAQFLNSSVISSFTSSGFSIGTEGHVNTTGINYVSWTFRKAPNFFDVVTYAGNGVSGRAVPHNLGIAPGCIIAKSTNSGDNWVVYHRSLSTPTNAGLYLNTTNATESYPFFPTAPDATNFYGGGGGYYNNSGGTDYVAYLFAHIPGSDGTIQCGSFTTDGSGYSGNVELGWEPQWVLIKNADATSSWLLVDNMRGWINNGVDTSDDKNLRPNATDAEATNAIGFPYATGFNAGYRGTAGQKWIYIAIRRGPMRTPTLGTSVFSPTKQTTTGYTQITGINFAPDFVFQKAPSEGSDQWNAVDKLRGPAASLTFNSQDPEAINAEYYLGGWLNNGVKMGTSSSGQFNFYNPNSLFFFQRAPGFMDVVCYNGGTGAVNHSLGVAPEMVIHKRRNSSGDWTVIYPTSPSETRYVVLNSTAASAAWGSNSLTATTINNIGSGGETYVAYLFASASGVSKVGTYTGNGSSQTINCAFTTGARFVLIKRTNSTGDWYVWDTARGIVAGNDPYLALNTTAAEVTSDDSVDTDSTGFIVNQVAASNVNVNAATYIFLAIA